MKQILAMSLVVVFVLTGCSSNPLTQSVYTELKIEDIKQIIQKEPEFEFVYPQIKKIRTSILHSDIDKAKYSDITYQDILKLVLIAKDTLTINSLTNNWTREWEESFKNVINLQEYIDQKVLNYFASTNRKAVDFYIGGELEYKEYTFENKINSLNE